MKASEMTNDELARELMSRVPLDSNNHDDIREAAARLRNPEPHCNCDKCVTYNGSLRRRLKVAEDALDGASDAFRFCIEQCELELGPKMIGKLCDDGKAVERALAAIREEGGES